MSTATHLVLNLRWGKRIGESPIFDSIIHYALWDHFYDCHMAITAEALATQYRITREEQDTYACVSLHRYAVGLAAGKWTADITSVSVPRLGNESTLIDQDENPRVDVTPHSLAKLAPAFTHDGSITAGNASSINDGAAAVVLASEPECKKRGLQPLAWIGGDFSIAVDPLKMGIGPAHAIRQLAIKGKRTIDEYDLYEINEAFAAQVLAVRHELKLDRTTLNFNGGAIALGHPVGASGARIVVTLAHELFRRKRKRAIGSTCIGGGMRIALELEQV